MSYVAYRLVYRYEAMRLSREYLGRYNPQPRVYIYSQFI
jgi:hypothetical protein